jgi:MoaA/NifB/PqqE/SkfB family radical SAM enzyme
MAAIVTNGSLLNEARIRELAESGLSMLTCSVLSLNTEEHDRIMGLPGCFENIMKARAHCRRYDIHYSLATVVSHKHFVDGEFQRFVDFAAANKVPIFINAMVPTTVRDQCDDLLTEDDVETLNSVTRKSVYVSTHLTTNFFGFGCPAGNAYLGVNVSGEVLPCFFFPVSLGNIQEVTLRTAWKRACRSPLFSRRHKMCYAAVSREFVYDYLNPVFERESFPIPIEEHPRYDQEMGGLADLRCADVCEAICYPKRQSQSDIDSTGCPIYRV